LALGFEWQIYSTAEKRVVATVHTRGEASLTKTTTDALSELSERAVAANVADLLGSAGFVAAFATGNAPPAQTVAVKGGSLSPLSYSTETMGPRPSRTAWAGRDDLRRRRMGSGFLIGAEGLLLTNRHVVGAAKYVKVRWPDGVETVGEVLRSETKRDVALVKTDARGRPPLRLQTHPAPARRGCYAIGTPLDEKYQSTVTRGIVSANRTFDGFSYIQSDVLVNHGNSGGPLLDKNANVVGITVSGYEKVETAGTLRKFVARNGDAHDIWRSCRAAARRCLPWFTSTSDWI